LASRHDVAFSVPFAGREAAAGFCASKNPRCPSLAAKGRRSRFIAISQLPAHQRKSLLVSFPFFCFRERIVGVCNFIPHLSGACRTGTRKSFIAVSFLLLFFCAPAFAANKSANGQDATPTGGLMCFSLMPAKKDAARQSCDQVCAAENASCVSLKLNGALNPGIGCADAIDPSVVASCRCCAVR
jgi:hypothetical protein